MGKELSSFSLDIFSLKGKTAMITGANQGLGVCYAIALARAGANISSLISRRILPVSRRP
jgi:2-deoxy-D-gluconate 3-dehydrogenase